MDELSNLLPKGPGAVGGMLAAAIIALAYILPKLLNGFKGDQLNGSVLDRLSEMEKHADRQDQKQVEQDKKIHKFAVKVTKLVIVVIRLEGLLMANNVPIPEDLKNEIADLKADGEPE